MNKIHLLWKIPLVLVILVLLINIFDFVGTTKIKVINALTGEPLVGMYVTQDIRGNISRGPAGSDLYVIRRLETKTNSDGVATFPVKFHIHIPFFKWFYGELIGVNQHGRSMEFNDNYYSGYIKFELSHLLPYKSQTVKLIPYVENLSQCKGDKECIFSNAPDLAFLNNDETYCEKLLMEGKDEFMKDNCYSTLAVSKANINLCQKVSVRGYGGRDFCERWVKEKWGKEVCEQWYSGNDRRFRTCENLLEKYGCQHYSDTCNDPGLLKSE